MAPDQIAAAVLDAHPELVERWALSSAKQISPSVVKVIRA